MGNLLTNLARLLDEEPRKASGKSGRTTPPRAIPRRLPRDLRLPPPLDSRLRAVCPHSRYALLIYATFHILTPYSGTPLFAQINREGRLLHRDWCFDSNKRRPNQPVLPLQVRVPRESQRDAE